ncbi:MAG: uroporphyrinogen decarboxylase family protein [Eubacterium sp.]
MNSRERVIATLNHKTPDKIPVDFCSGTVSGINVSVMDDLRKRLGLPEKTVKIFCPFQMLAYMEEDMRELLHIDMAGVYSPYNKFGLKNDSFKPFTLFNGKVTDIAESFQYTKDSEGNIYAYPKGDLNAQASAKMPNNGYYFDNINRETYDEDDLDGRRDFKNTFTIFSDEVMRDMEEQTQNLYTNTTYGISAQFGQGSFGEPSILPGPAEETPMGIRKFDDWLMALYTEKEYVKDAYGYQTEIALKNLKQYKEALGNKINIIQLSATDFGTQNGQFFSNEIFREMYMPYLKELNDWIHQNTEWKVFYHTCGSIINLMDDLIESGMDIVNPVQCSAEGMDPTVLKERFGDRVVFHGGGINTQKTLPFGTPEEVYAETTERLNILGKGGGYIFNTIHNIQYGSPMENVVSLFKAVSDFNAYKK